MMQGFEEVEKPLSDSPMLGKESLKVLVAQASNKDSELATIDIRAAFLKAKVLDRKVYLNPPKDQR